MSELPLRVTHVWTLLLMCAPPLPRLLRGSGGCTVLDPVLRLRGHEKAAMLTQQHKRQNEDCKFLFSLESLFVAFVLYIPLEYLKQGYAFTSLFPTP